MIREMCTGGRAALFLLLLVASTAGCSETEPGRRPLTAEVPLHLEEHMDVATIEGSEVTADIPQPVEWRFDQPQPDWQAVRPIPAGFDPVTPVRVDDALRLPLTGANRNPDTGRLLGSIYVRLPDWSLADWTFVEIRARTSDPMRKIGLVFNYTEEDANGVLPYYAVGDRAPLVTDGTVLTYRLSLDWSWEGPWTHLGIWFNTRENQESSTLDILSVSVIPREATYAQAPVGVLTEVQSAAHRRTVYSHTPGWLEYLVRVPEAGRLDLGLGVLREGTPVSFRITAQVQGGEVETLLEETYGDRQRWAQRSLDLSHLAGRTINLRLEADAERAGTVAFWAAPTLSGVRTADKPNVIFYVIDGGGADHMSVYGYNRRTTPNLERLAAEGAVFEWAYSNSTWSKPSTTSFMTSLHHSVLGGLDEFDPLPEQAVTMAQHLHRAGYQTAVLTTNSYAGAMSSLDRGVDVLRDTGTEHSVSSVELHENYWRWRQAYPGQPYWVHFQTTDVHRGDAEPGAPFAGLFISPELRERYLAWQLQLEEAGGNHLAHLPDSAALTETGIDPVAFFHARRNIYDEAMAHQDYQLGRLVERLKARDEWKHTLLIVAADHSTWHAGLRDPSLTDHDPMFRSLVTRIPLLVFWPGRIAGSQRFSQPVSMIDVLPTILDLVGLPMPEIMQGQSLAPLLLGEQGWEPRPVILDEFYVDEETGKLRGVIEVIDGRWGASLRFDPRPENPPDVDPAVPSGRPAPLLLYDLWNDPYCRKSLHEERPDLVKKYTEFLQAQFRAHQALGQHFTRAEESPLTSKQLETLRSLGYIQ